VVEFPIPTPPKETEEKQAFPAFMRRDFVGDWYWKKARVEPTFIAGSTGTDFESALPPEE
jgi:hypothetical protein